MKLHVQYNKEDEHEKYETTLEELVDSFNGAIPESDLKPPGWNKPLVIRNGYAITTIWHFLDPECTCEDCIDIDWDAPCPNCLDIGSASGRPQRDCCGCHQGDWHYENCRSEWWELNIIPV